jgi:monoamine oxidase
MDGDLVLRRERFGHAMRDLAAVPSVEPDREVEVLVVGAGVAGLAASWKLLGAGVENLLVVEIDGRAGGTAQAGKSATTPFPWGAHYITAPLPENRALIDLLDELQVLEGRAEDGAPIVAEQHLCADPAERLFFRGRWYEGIFPRVGASKEELREWQRFEEVIGRLAERRDASGRRGFVLPLSVGAPDGALHELDSISMAAWLERERFTSGLLRWWVDYACRDDYGALSPDVSAWAGLHYFASRRRDARAGYQPVITWPQGNARIIEHWQERLGAARVLSERAVVRVRNAGSKALVTLMGRDGALQAISARHVVLAVPGFVAARIAPEMDDARKRALLDIEHGAWMVANIHVGERPAGVGFPLAWDNVFFDSPSLGYVVANHQTGPSRGPTVLTYYYPLTDTDTRAARKRLLSLDWQHWAEVVVSDLERAHPDIRRSIQRIDVARWGHAMVRPTPGTIWGASRSLRQQPIGAIHFAHSDLSGLALFEEAFDQGLRAGEEILRARAEAS